MEIRELRIGNYYQGASRGNIETVTWQTLRDLSEGKLNLLPIPLTEEILFKFGFEKIKSDEYPHKYIINKYMSDEVEIENLNSQNCFIFSHGKKFSSMKIEYVHQLQNLYFCLCGKELAF